MIANKTTEMAGVYTDFDGIAKLKAEATNQTDAAKRETARQFEAMFLQMMIKSMREAGGKGLLDSDQTDMARDMYDKQLAIDLSKKGSLGIAEIVMRQLGVSDNEPKSAPPAIPSRSTAFAEKLWGKAPQSPATHAEKTPQWETPEAFVQSLYPAAQKAADKLGTEPETILAFAALETGWGKHVMNSPEGSSNNLFGIKADSRWQASSTFANTLEFESGAMQQRREKFRSYPTAEDSVLDFAEFIRNNPRYQQALENAKNADSFIEHVHKAGYATDPDYAEKVKSVMQSVRAITKEKA